jgi:hypothetical protein
MANQPQPQQNRPLNEAELQRLAVSTSQVGSQEIMMAAMFAKQLQGDINGIKRQAAEVGGGLKVSDVDMSKVMPSHILPAMGIRQPQQQRLVQQPAPQPIVQPDFQFIAPPVQQIQETNLPPSDPNQLEFNLNKQTRYEDIINAIDKLENKVNILTDKVNQLIDSNNKKKPKITNGT